MEIIGLRFKLPVLVQVAETLRTFEGGELRPEIGPRRGPKLGAGIRFKVEIRVADYCFVKSDEG